MEGHLLQPVLTQLELPELQMCHSCVQVGLQQWEAPGEAFHNQFLLWSMGQLSHYIPKCDLNLHGSMNRTAAPSLDGFVADLFFILEKWGQPETVMNQPLLQGFTATRAGVGHFHLCGTSQRHVSYRNPFLLRPRPHKIVTLCPSIYYSPSNYETKITSKILVALFVFLGPLNANHRMSNRGQREAKESRGALTGKRGSNNHNWCW